MADQPSTPRVLIVEDESLIRMALADFLEQSGFAVVEAESGDEAAALLNAGTEVDVVFTDVRMPGHLDGFQFANWVHEHLPGLPVYLTSGDIGTVDRKNILAPGELFLQKPYSFDEVVSLMQKAVPAHLLHSCQH